MAVEQCHVGIFDQQSRMCLTNTGKFTGEMYEEQTTISEFFFLDDVKIIKGNKEALYK